jgi:hypothetical protein
VETLNKLLLTLVSCIIIAATIYSVTDGFAFAKNTPPLPEVRIDIRSNTEYYGGDSGKILALLINQQGNPVSATCQASITYPNQSFFIQNGATTQTSLGSYELTFTSPGLEGVYEYTANCTVGPKNYLQGKSFHVSNATSIILNTLNENQNEVTLILQNLSLQINESTTNLSTGQTTTNNLILSTNQSLSFFQNETTNNLQTIINLLANVSQNQSLGNLSTSITTLTTILLQFQNDTNINFTQVINLLLAANQSINTNIDMTQQLILQVNNSINQKLDLLLQAEQAEENTTLQALYSINQTIMQAINALNFTLSNTSINIYVTANDCLEGGTWLIQATVTNQFGVPYSQPPMTCTVTTSNWGLASMNYNGALRLWQYTHACDYQGNIPWTVDCQ